MRGGIEGSWRTGGHGFIGWWQCDDGFLVVLGKVVRRIEINVCGMGCGGR